MQSRRPLFFDFFAVALLVSACGEAPDETEHIGQAEQADTVCAAGETVDGIDVSRWQESIDWAAVAAGGTKFAIARAAYGLSQDIYFDANWPAMADNGLVRGAYQWFLPQEDPIAQAQFLLDVIGPLGPLDLPPVADVEDTGGQSPATIANNLMLWMQHIEAAIGRKPIIYTGKYFWQDNVGSTAFVDYPLWIPNYSYDCPNLPNGTWADWRFFQYTSTGSVSGIAGNVDLDVFNGSYDQLLGFIGGGYAAAFVSQSFPYAADPPFVMEAGDVIDAHIELKNVGTKTWNASTMLATSEPRDRDSAFAGAEWPAPNRLAAVVGEVPPGATYKFSFKLHAPSEPGIYSEYFSVVQEGEAWFSDPGQGGPPDDQLQGKFEVLAAPGGGTPPGHTPPGNPSADEEAAEEDGGCALRPAQHRPEPVMPMLLALALATLMRRRRTLAVAILASSAAACTADIGGEGEAASVSVSSTGGGASQVGAGGSEPDPMPDPMCSIATTPCQDQSECCTDLECGMTTLGQVCCGNEGVPCTTENGEDCCGDLLCVAGTCGYEPEPCEAPCKQPPALIVEKNRLAAIGGSFLGICGDANHTYGYHVPAANLPPSDYSLEGSANIPVCVWYASAIDIGMDWQVSHDWLHWLIQNIAADNIKGIAEVIGSYDGYNVRYWSDNSGWSENGVPYTGSGHDTWTHVSIYRSTALVDHGILAGWTATSGP